MAIKSGFFMDVNGDREYKADFFARYFASFISNGVFSNPSTSMQIMANNDMTVTLKVGKAWIDGYIAFNDDDYILNIDVADGVLNRVDRIVLRLDTTIDRSIKVLVKKGTFASLPLAPNLQRDADAYELALADIYISKGAISITQANITDLRLDNELCGIVTGVVDQVDVTTLYNQYSVLFEAKRDEFEQDFMNWFQTLESVLDENTAANLLNMITQVQNDLNTHLTNYTDYKNATNTSIEKIEKEIANYNSYATLKDDNGIFTVVDYKRADGTLYMKSTLSNADADGNYLTSIWQLYNDNGISIIETIVWTIEYDEDGDVISKVVSE